MAGGSARHEIASPSCKLPELGLSCRRSKGSRAQCSGSTRSLISLIRLLIEASYRIGSTGCPPD